MGHLIVAVDFDGTLADHRYPEIGDEVPGAFEALRALRAAGARLVLWTMRSGGRGDGTDPLAEAVSWCRDRGVEFDGVNASPGQESWTTSPKAYAHVYVDDAAFGCPLRANPRMGGRPFVDWSVVGPALLALAAAR